jgi:transposase
MQAPLFVRPPTEEEEQALAVGLRSADAFTLRRCQIVRASARGEHVPAIARALGCSDQTVRDAIHAFDAAGGERLRDLLHRSPREFGHDTSLWTLEMVAETAHAEGLTATCVSGETVRTTLARLGIRWRRAKDWITSPDPAYARKKARATA